MPPIQTYVNEQEEMIEVIRKVSEWDKPPTEEETEGKKGPWKKVIGQGIQKRRSAKWGPGKSYWGGNVKPNGRTP